jgi:hypothetical protein
LNGADLFIKHFAGKLLLYTGRHAGEFAQKVFWRQSASVTGSPHPAGRPLKSARQNPQSA